MPCAYALAKLRFPGRSVLFALVLIGPVHPDPGPGAAALYRARANSACSNTYFALMFPFFLSVFAIFLFRQFFSTFPDEIIDAARLDGVSEFEIVWRIVVPSAWPAIAAFAVFSFVAHWNDLYWPLIVISDTRHGNAAARHDVFRERGIGNQLRRAQRGCDHLHRSAPASHSCSPGNASCGGITMSG